MSRPSLILVGAGGHARACIDVIDEQGGYGIAGLVGLREDLHTVQLGYSVVGTDDDLPELAKKYSHALVTVGQIRSAEPRIRLYRLLSAQRWTLPSIVAPTAHVSRHATIGAGTIVMHGAIINAGATVGANCIVNSRALIEHDARVADHCHISTGAILNGGASVGAGTFIGSGSVVREGISVGEGCIVGMGVAVRKDVADGARAPSAVP
jgi:sugar O-acyltransferase (sialic acid O-acetyltransferase NeuD family)